MIRAAVFALAFLFAGPALAVERPATCETLVATARAAQPGDVIQLTGECPRLNTPSNPSLRKADPGVVITGGTINGADFNLWEGFTFRNVTFTAGITSSQAKRFTIEGSRVLGLATGWETSTPNAVKLVAVQDFNFINNEISGWGQGLAIAGINDKFPAARVVISGNLIRHIAWDGIRGFGYTTDVTVSNNVLSGFAAIPGAHKDAIQGFAGPATNLTVTGNIYDGREFGARRQFLFFQNAATNVLMTNNEAFGAGPYCAAFNGAASGVIADNYCVPFTGYGAANVTPNAGAALVTRNNVTVGAVDPKDPAALAAWALRRDPPKTIEDRVTALEARVKALELR